MKSLMIGIGIFIFGFLLVAFCAGRFNGGNAESAYYNAIIFSILYLCAIVGISTSLILKEVRKN